MFSRVSYSRCRMNETGSLNGLDLSKSFAGSFAKSLASPKNSFLFFVNRLGLTVAFFLYPFVDRFREEWEEDEEEEEEEVF